MKGVLALQRAAFVFEAVLLVASGIAAIWLALHDQRIGDTPAYVFVGVGCFLLSLPLVLTTLIVMLERRERALPKPPQAPAAAGVLVCPRCGEPWAAAVEEDDLWFLRQQGLLERPSQRCPNCGAHDVVPVLEGSPASVPAGLEGVPPTHFSLRLAWLLLGGAAMLAAGLSLLGLLQAPSH